MAKQLNVNLAFRADTGQAKAQIQELQGLLNKIMHSSSTATFKGVDATKIKQAASAAKELQMHLNNAFNADTGKFDLSQLDKSLKASGSNITNLSTQLLNAGNTGQQAFMKLAQSISLADQPMLKISNRLNEFATTMKNTARWQLSSSMLHGFMGAVQSAYGYAQDLNKSLTDIRIVTGQNAEQMAKFAEQANKAAKTLSTTTTDYTNASLIYYQQGLSDQEVAERTEVTIKMANAAGESAEKVSDQLTAVWNNFYDGSQSLEHYADVMTALGAATASSTDEIAGGLEKFAAIADTIGLSYEYAASALATITSNTRQSEEVVGTALKTIFARIQGLNLGETLDDGTTLNKYSEALQKVGLSIFDQNNEIKNMDTILDEMADKWDKLSKDQQMALAQTVAGTRQYTQLVALMDNWNAGDSDSMIANLKTATEATGALDEQAEIYAESWEAASDRVRASAEGLYQSLLDDDFFIDINNGFAEMVSGLDAFIDGAGGLKTIIVGLSSIIISNFANKIPEAIQTAKYNMDVLTKGSAQAYQNIQKDMQSATSTMFDKHGVSKDSSLGFMIQSSNDLASARTKLSVISDKMSSTEKQMAETELALMQAQQEEIYTLKQKNEALEQNIALQKKSLEEQQVTSTGQITEKAYKHDEDLVKRLQNLKNDPDALAGDAVGLEKFRTQYSAAIDSVESSISGLSQQLLTAFNEGSKGAQNITTHFEDVAKAAQMIKTNLGDLSLGEAQRQVASLKDLIPQAVQEASGLDKIFHEIATATNENELSKGVDKLVNSLNKCEIPADKLKRVLSSLYGEQKIKQLDNDMKTLKSNTDKAKEGTESLKNSINGFQPTHIIRTSEALGSLAGLAGNTATTINSVVSVFKNLTNPDLSGWEKFSSILMAFSFTVPTVMTGLKNLGTITSWLGGQFESLNLITSISGQQLAAQQVVANMSALAHKRIVQALGEETAASAINLAATMKRKGATEEEIAAKVKSYLIDEAGIEINKANSISKTIATNAEKLHTTSILGGVSARLMEVAATAKANGHLIIHNVLMTIANALTGNWVAIGKVLLGVLAAVATVGFLAWLEKVIITEKEANETISESISKWKEAKNELESLNSELETTQDRIKELEAMDSLSIVEQEELDKLLEQEASLQRQVALQEQIAKGANVQVAEDFEDNFSGLQRGLSAGPKDTTRTFYDPSTAGYAAGAGSEQLTPEQYKAKYIDSLYNEDGSIAEANVKLAEERQKYYDQWLIDEANSRAQWLADNQETLSNMESGYLAWLEANPNATDEQKDTYTQTISNAYKNAYGDDYEEVVYGSVSNIRAKEEEDNNYSIDNIINNELDTTDVESAAKDLSDKFSDTFKNQLYSQGIVPKDYAKYLIEQNKEITDRVNKELKKAGTTKDGKDVKQNVTLDALKKDDRWKEEDLEILTKIKVENGDTLESIFEKIDEYKENEIAVNFNAKTWGQETAQKQAVVEDLEIGDTISTDDFAILGDAYKEYFELQNDGTYRLISAAEDLKAAIDAIENKKALENIKTESENIQKVESVGLSTESAQNLINRQNEGEYIGAATQDLEAYRQKVEEVYRIECESVQAAIDIMVQHNEQLSATQGALFNSANSLYELQAMRGQVLEETGSVDYGQYAEALMNLGSQYDNCSQEVEKYKQALIGLSDEMASSDAATRASAEEYIKQAEDILNASILIGEASKKYGFDAEVVERQAKQYKKLHPEMELTAEQAAQLAINNQRMNKGMKTLNDNFADWKKILKSADKTTMDYADAVVDCTDAIADLVGASDDLELPDEFFNDKNMKLIEKAMKGDTKAVNQLGAAVAAATVDAMEFNDAFADMINELDSWNGETPDIKLSHEQFDSDKAIVLQGIQDIQNGVISAGAAMDGEWVAALNRMALTTGMSVEQMNGLLGSLGVQAKVETTYVPQKMQVPTYIEKAEPTTYTEYETHSTGNEGETKQVPVTRIGWRKYTIPSEPVTVEGYAAVAQISTEDNPLTAKVTSNTVKGGGSPAASYSGHRGSASPSSTKGKSGGGGGGGSKAKPEKVEKTKKSDVVERYKEIEDKLDDVRDSMEDASRAADRLYGKNRINEMKKVGQSLQKEIGLLKDKRKEAEKYLEVDKDALKAAAKKAKVNFTFDDQGNISNYEEEMTKLYNRLAAAEKKADPKNFKTKEAQDAYIEKNVTPLKDQIEALEEAIGQYDETRELIEDLDNEAQEKFNEWQDNNFEILNYELELKLEVDDAELRRLEYLLSKIEDDFYNMAEAAALMIGNTNNNGGLDVTNSQLEVHKNKLEEIKEQKEALDKAYEKGEISQDAYVEGLKELEDLAYDNAEAIQEIDKIMLHYYGDTLEAAADELSKYTDLMEQHVEVLEHYSNIMNIIGKSTDYEAMGVILEGQAEAAENMAEVSKANYEMLEAQRQARRADYEAAIGSATDEELEVLKQKWLDAEAAANDAQDRMMEDIETWAESLKAILENKLAGFAQALENVLTGDFGSFDEMTAAMDRANSLQEEYLTTTNKIYETNKLINKAQQDIDKTTNTAAKKRLQAYIDETEQLQNQAELSNYELEIQQAKYDLVLAEIALEEAQNAKSTVRLQRDAEGNFGYVYTADSSKIAEAEQQLEDAQNRLYNIGLRGANEYTEKYQQTLQEMYDTLTELQNQYLEGAFESEAEYNEAVRAAKEFYFEKLKQYSNLYQIALTTDSAVVADAWSTDFNNMMDKTYDWSVAVDDYLYDVKEAFRLWEEQVETIRSQTVGPDLDALKTKVGDITEEHDLMTEGIVKEGGVIDALKAEIEQVNGLTGAYANVRNQITKLQKEHEDLIDQLRKDIKDPTLNETVEPTPQKPKEDNKSSGGSSEGNSAPKSDVPTLEKGSRVSVKPGTKWYYDSYGTAPSGTARGGTISYINLSGSHPYNIEGLGWIKKTDIVGFDTGGYTGEWAGQYGKFALLHQKELILNPDDTSNLLSAMDVLEKILQTLDLVSLNSQLGGLLHSPSFGTFNQETLQQNVTIEASFPGVSFASEIEDAFGNLVNLASQYANRK